jgi:hypothetical protein
MRKPAILVALLLSASSLSLAQSQRLVLAEEFTQASCGPCASQNPAFNALLSNNTTKVVALKYQTAWPGVDPMNQQNPAQVNTRVTYYDVNGVPHALLDGVAATGTSYVGAPANIKQATIDTAYADPSPFTMNLSHSLSPDYDSVYTTLTITASQAGSFTGPLKAHIVLVEKQISFANPPGTNGEKVFHSVMRRMLPDDQGTTLPTSWTIGQIQTITIGTSVPSYIYSLNELAVVAFIQDNSNKSVKQAAFSAAQPLALDGGIADNLAIPATQCATSITPTVVLTNSGTTTLTSATISYQIDNGTPSTQSWTGSLAPGASQQITLPAISVTAGTHTFTSTCTNINGTPDNNTRNNSAATKFVVQGTPAATPVTEGLQATTFPPADWALDNPDKTATWVRSTPGGYGKSSHSAKMEFYKSNAGQADDFYAPMVSMSTAISPAWLKFNVAYAPVGTKKDQLQVLASTDCGQTWMQLYSKSGTGLATAPATNFVFVPTAAQWRKDSVSLDALIGQDEVLIKFRALSDKGNTGYIDDINVTHAGNVVGIRDNGNLLTGFSFYPNPFSDVINLNISAAAQQTAVIRIMNILGAEVYTTTRELSAGSNSIQWNGTSSAGDKLPAGAYFVSVVSGNEVYTGKIALK